SSSSKPAATTLPYTTLFRSPRLASDEVVLHLNEEGVAPPHRDPHPGEEVITAARGALEPQRERHSPGHGRVVTRLDEGVELERRDRKSTRLNSSHDQISYAV